MGRTLNHIPFTAHIERVLLLTCLYVYELLFYLVGCLLSTFLECSEVSYCGLSDVSSYNVGCLWFVCNVFSCRWHKALVLSCDRNSCIRLLVCFKSVAGKKGYIKCLLDVFCRWEHLQAVCPLELGIWQQGMMAALSASSVKKSFNFDCKSRSYLVYTSIAVQVNILWPSLESDFGIMG